MIIPTRPAGPRDYGRPDGVVFQDVLNHGLNRAPRVKFDTAITGYHMIVRHRGATVRTTVTRQDSQVASTLSRVSCYRYHLFVVQSSHVVVEAVVLYVVGHSELGPRDVDIELPSASRTIVKYYTSK